MTPRSKIAKDLFNKGYNCAQAVFAAFSDITELSFEDSIKIASSFGGGMGGLREVCGALTGAFMAAGLIYGYDSTDGAKAKESHYALIREIAKLFEDENQSIICDDLLKLQDQSKQEGSLQSTKVRTCEELVIHATDILDKMIANGTK